MRDPQRKPPKPPSQPNAPTLRPRGLPAADEARTVAGAYAVPDDPFGIADLEALTSEVEVAVAAVEAFEQKQRISSAPDLHTGRPPETPPRRLPAIGTFGPYAIVGRLAIGGMAEILLAREESEGAGSRYLVVKRILAEYERDQAFVEMFLDEARVMMRLKHPNVCHVYKFGKQDGTHFIAMEWVNGASLGKIIRRARKTGGLPMGIACKIIAHVAEALDHAHMAKNDEGRPMGIVHRDATPDNIMLSYDGAVKLLDFGIAKADARGHKTQAGVVKGKFAYMAPEQCRAKELDHRVDIFALGVCLYEALTGRPLYRRETEFETMEAIVRGPVPSLAERMKDAPPELEAIIQKCLAKKAEDRFSTAGELSEALVQFSARQGEVVTGRRMAEMMDKLFMEEQRRGPLVDTTPFGSSFHMGSDAQSYGLSTGDGDALADLPPLPGLDDFGASLAAAIEGAAMDEPPFSGPEAVAPAYGLELELDNASPGATPAWAKTAPLDVGVAHTLSKDRRRNPTAPPLSSGPSGPSASGMGGGAKAALGILALLLVLGGAGAALFVLWPDGFGAVFGGGEAVETTGGPAAVLTGTLEVTSEPPGATLFVDDVERGLTPVTVPDLVTGTHRLRLVLEGHQTHEGQLEVRADHTSTLRQTLHPDVAPEGPVVTGRLTITSRVPARVFHDGEDLGPTPLRNVVLPAGVVALELETADGVRHRQGVLVPAHDHASTHLDLRD